MSRPRRSRAAPTGPLAALGTAAAERRRRLGLTQQDAADLAGVGVSSIAAVEAGSDRTTAAVLLRILDSLGLALAAGPADAVASHRDLLRVGGDRAP